MSKKIIIILISALVCIGAVTTYFVLSKDGKKEEINVIDKQKKLKNLKRIKRKIQIKKKQKRIKRKKQKRIKRKKQKRILLRNQKNQ